MSTDKNTIIGFVLLGILFFLFFWQTNQSNETYLKEQKRLKDSTDRVEASKIKPIDPKTAALNDLSAKAFISGNFKNAAIGTEQLTFIETDVARVAFSNKGGRIKYVELKNYKSYSGSLIKLGDSTDVLSYNINTANNIPARTDELYFTPSTIEKNSSTNAQSIKFSLKDSLGRSIVHTYIIKNNDYMIDWNVDVVGANTLLTGGLLNLQWKLNPSSKERSILYERQMSNVCFSEGNSFDYISSKKEWKFEKPIQWIGVVQQFFNTTIVSKNNFNDGSVSLLRKTDSSNLLCAVEANLQIKSPVTSQISIPFQLYYGPNDYKILKKQAAGMDDMVNLGRDVYSFVRPINKYIIMPVFDFFASFVKNFGWVIMLLTIFIRLVTSPLTYSSYLSGAKMKVLRPEIDTLKKKFGEDQQGFAVEQMKLFREAGVNPVGGCIPALLQIPIFFALYSFFNSNIDVRGKAFLWSHDLAQYDVIAQLPFSIPFGYGDHVSLFTITAVITSFGISMYNLSSTPTQDNPAMKYMPYIFPFFMLFFFNRLPSALTWYYTVSNTLTLLLQFIIQQYIIDHDKILAKMQEARSKPKTKSKWQERYGQMMDAQKKVEDLKAKNQKALKK